MINRITVISPYDDIASYKTSLSDTNDIYLTDADGLGPAKAILNSSSVATQDGRTFNSSRVDNRSITLTFMYRVNSDVAYNRQLLYRYFPPKKAVTIILETDNRNVYVQGLVESNAPSIFTQKPSSQIVIQTESAYLKKYDPSGQQKTEFFNILDEFEFPFENASVTNNLLEFSSIAKNTAKIIQYDGEATTGLTVTASFTGNVSNFAIFDSDRSEVVKIDSDRLLSFTGNDLQSGDVIFISTEPGSKAATLIRNGVSTNILNCLAAPTNWLNLYPGQNKIEYTASSGVSNVQIVISNDVLYEGV